jgi:hypothetical protein
MTSIILNGVTRNMSVGLPSSLFSGFQRICFETYTASPPFVDYLVASGFEQISVVFGSRSAFPKYVLHNMGLLRNPALSDRLLKSIIQQKTPTAEAYADSALELWVSAAPSHRKIFLLESATEKRVVVGSANASQQALDGPQEEVVVYYDHSADPKTFNALAAHLTAKMVLANRLGLEEAMAWIAGRRLP